MLFATIFCKYCKCLTIMPILYDCRLLMLYVTFRCPLPVTVLMNLCIPLKLYCWIFLLDNADFWEISNTLLIVHNRIYEGTKCTTVRFAGVEHITFHTLVYEKLCSIVNFFLLFAEKLLYVSIYLSATMFMWRNTATSMLNWDWNVQIEFPSWKLTSSALLYIFK